MEAAMATRKKAKGKAKRKKTRVSKAKRSTVRKIKAVRKKKAKKTPARAAPPKKAGPIGKIATKPAPSRESVPKAAAPIRPAKPVSSEQRIGVVTHYYSHLSVATMKLEPGATLRVGDVIHIRGHTTDFTQRVESLEVSHAPAREVGPNDDFGIKVIEHAREHDVVFKARQ
jgi:hypothetical protein